MAIKIFSILMLFGWSFGTTQAQEVYTSSGRTIKQADKDRRKKDQGFDKSKIIFGGGLGGGFDQYTAAFSISPILGYKITDRFAAGVGLSYQYLRVKDFYPFANSSTSGGYDYYPLKANFVAPSVWTRYIVWRNIFAHVEYEHNFMSFKEYRQVQNLNTGALDVESFKTNLSVPCLLVGAGIRQPITDRFSMVAILLYDVIQDKYSPYLNRFDVRIGFNVGF